MTHLVVRGGGGGGGPGSQFFSLESHPTIGVVNANDTSFICSHILRLKVQNRGFLPLPSGTLVCVISKDSCPSLILKFSSDCNSFSIS